MAVTIKANGNRGLNFTAHLSIDEATRNAQELKKVLSDLGINNATQAQKTFNQTQIHFQNELKRARLELAALKKEEQEMLNATARTSAATAELTRKIAANRLEQQELTKAARLAREANKATVGSYKEAQERLKVLGAEIKNTTGGFQKMTPELRNKINEYNQLNDSLKKFDASMGNHQRNVGNYKKALEGLKGLAGQFLGAGAILAAGRQILMTNAEISDSMADLRRTSGLTAKEAENLADQLKKIDTRTSLKGLLEIATIGGQLGIAKDQLGGFTTAVNQLAVALGGELAGGAEGIAKSLGVLDNIFGITKSNSGDVEKSYNQIGSAILGLGQSGLATGDYLTDFGNRVGGIAQKVGLSLPVILSYGAVLQESGVNAEVAGSSFNRLLSALTTNRAEFFNIAKLADSNLTLSKFTNLINSDIKGALDLFFNGLAKGGKSTTSFNDILDKLQLTGVGVSQGIAALAGQQESLNGHISQATKDFNDATLAADQYALKNDNLAGSIDKLGNTITNLTTNPDSNLGRWLKGFIDNVNGGIKAVDAFIGNVRKKQYDIAIGRLERNGGKTTGNLFISVDEAMAEKQKRTLDKITQDRANALKIGDRMAHDAIIDAKAEGDANAVLAREIKKLNDIRQQYSLNTKKGVNNGQVTLDLIAQRQAVDVLRKTFEKPKPVGDSPTSKTPVKSVSGYDAAIKAQRALQAEIDQLAKKGQIKAQEADEEEIDRINLKYDTLRKKAKQYNDDVVRFNNDPKNKFNKTFVNTSGLDTAQNAELDDARAKIATEKIKKTLDEQKVLFDDFEKSKADLGTKYAEEKYGKDLGTAKSYLEKLEQMRSAIVDKQKSKGADGDELTSVEKAELKVIEKQIEEQKKLEGKKYEELLKQFMSYENERTKIIEQFADERSKLDKDKNQSEIIELDIKEKEKLNSLDDAHVQQLGAYKRLFEGIDELSDFNAKKVINDAKNMLSELVQKGKISDELRKQIESKLKEGEKSIDDKLPKKLKQLGSEISSLAGEVSGLDEKFGQVLGTVGNVVGQVGNIKSGLADFNKSGATDLEKLGAGLGILGAGVSIFKSVFALFDKSAQREAQASYARDLQNKQTEALNKALERQVALLDKVYGTEKIRKYDEAIKQARENQAKYTAELSGKFALTGNKIYDDLISKLNNGEKINPLDNGNLVKALQSSSIIPTDIATLQRLLDEGKLDAATATIVQNLIKAKETAEELANNLRAERVGAGIDTIVDEFFTAMTDGSNSLEDSLTKSIRRGLLEGLRGDLTQKYIQDFYAKLDTALSDGRISSDEDAELKALYKAAEDYGKKKLDYINSVAPEMNKNGSSSQSAASGIIRTQLTEETGQRLDGIMRAQYDATKMTNTLLNPIGKTIGDFYLAAKANFDVQVKIEQNTFRTANNTDLLNAKLDAIINNTKPALVRGMP